MSESAHESIEDYLKHEDCLPLYRVVLDVTCPCELDYEDWAKPMRMSAGQLCLRETGRYGKETIYYAVESGDRMRAVAVGDGDSEVWAQSPPEAINWLRDALREPEDLYPVLRERTPFDPVDGDHDG